MRTTVRVGLTLFTVFLVSVLCLFSGCQTEEVADFSEETGIEGVVRDLADSSTQVEAEAAIRNLLIKVEMGREFPGSRYALYTLSDEDIAGLAEENLLHLNGNLQLTLGYIFDSIMYVADVTPFPEMEYDTAMDILRAEMDAALADPEEPGNALLVAIASEDGIMPEIAPYYEEDTVRSPLQTLLFAIWFHRKYAGLSAMPDEGSLGDLAPFLLAAMAPLDPDNCYHVCWVHYQNEIRKCNGDPDCEAAASAAYEACLESCHDQGASGQ